MHARSKALPSFASQTPLTQKAAWLARLSHPRFTLSVCSTEKLGGARLVTRLSLHTNMRLTLIYVIDLPFSVANDISIGSLQCEEARIEPQDSPHTAG